LVEHIARFSQGVKEGQQQLRKSIDRRNMDIERPRDNHAISETDLELKNRMPSIFGIDTARHS